MTIDPERAPDPVARLFELSLDMLGTASTDGYFTRLNSAWERTLGWSREQLMAEPLIAFVHPDDVAATLEQSARLSAPGSPAVVRFENRYRTRDGGHRRIQWSTVADGGTMYFVAKDVTESRASALERERAAALHQALTANLPDTSIFLLDRDLRVLIASGDPIEGLPWFDVDRFRGRTIRELSTQIPTELLKQSVERIEAALRGEQTEFEFTVVGLTFSIQTVPVRAEDGSVESALVVARDVTERTRSQRQLARRARQQNAVAELGRFALQSRDVGELMSEAVATATATLDVEIAGVLELNQAGDALKVAAAVGLPGHGGPAPAIPLSETPTSIHTIATGEPTIVDDWATETRSPPPPLLVALGVISSVSVRIDGRDLPFGLLVVHAREPRRFARDDVAFLSAVATLVSVAIERDRDERATRHAALHDPLTGLPNRTLALDRLGQALQRQRREGIHVAVLALDLDRFKIINDSLGHAAGDEALLALAPKLTGGVRSVDTVARIGGDEFLVICPDIEGVRGAAEVAERLAAAVNSPLVLKSGVHFFTVSIGITLAADEHDTADSLVRDADAAMYRAKERGRGGYELFDEEMRTSIVNRVRTESDLRHALEHGELEVWYQPVIDLANGRPVSTEALVRWNHPDRGVIGPRDFIDIAEESGLVAALGQQVLEQACAQTAAWQRDLIPGLRISVNVSGQQAVNPSFPAQVAETAARSGLRAGTLALEITETVLMEQAEAPATVLGTLHEHGLVLILDDFGTGYSSLSRLKALPLDVLKIDRSFVSGVAANTDDRAIVKATIDMAHAVGLKVVAEGVETRAQEQHLLAFGCDYAQGYLYARPQPARATTVSLAGALR